MFKHGVILCLFCLGFGLMLAIIDRITIDDIVARAMEDKQNSLSPVLPATGLLRTALQPAIRGQITRRIPVAITISCLSATDSRRGMTVTPCLAMWEEIRM